MKGPSSVRTAMLFLGAAVLAGCGDDGADSPAPAVGEELRYPNGHPLATPSGDPVVLSLEEEMTTLTNAHRIQRGLSPLVHLGSLREVGRAQAKHMGVHDFFAHVNPEGDGPGSRLSLAGVSWSKSGENLAAGHGTVGEAFDAWLASPEHRSAIEDPEWTHVGSGYWEDPADGGSVGFVRYYVQLFVRRP